MPRRSPTLAHALDNACPIIRSLGVLSDAWCFLVVREAHLGARTFAEFRQALGIASDVLSARLGLLVEQGVLEKAPYQEPGQRTRDAYDLTPAGHELKTVLVALQQWGNANIPRDPESQVESRSKRSGGRVSAQLIDENGDVTAPTDVQFALASA